MGKIDQKENLIRLIDQYQNLIFSICLRMTGDYFTAEDLTQETFLAAYRNWDRFEGGSEKAWLCRIATNKCIDHCRSSMSKTVISAEEEIQDVEAAGRDGPLQQVLNREIMQELEHCCNMLSPPYAEVARMYFLEGKQVKEITEQTGAGLNTVKTRIHRAREMLKKHFRKELLQE